MVWDSQLRLKYAHYWKAGHEIGWMICMESLGRELETEGSKWKADALFNFVYYATDNCTHLLIFVPFLFSF